MKSFSIIVPYFNSSKYIEKNLKSIIDQNYSKDKIQIILVDDGSDEDSEKIIREIEVKYNFKIDFYKKNNGNWGSVVNFVLKNKIATNDLIMVLDSDDALKENCFEYVNNKVLDSDIYAITYKRWDGSQKETKKVYPYWTFFSLIKNKRKKTPFCAPLHYFYKNELFYQLEPLKEGVFFQDSVLLAQLMNKANKIRYTKKPLSLYFYNRPDSSTNQSWTENRFYQEYDACLKLIELGWEEIVIYRLSVKEFRNACEKHNIKFEINNKVKFHFFPLIIRLLYNLFYLFKIKKYLSFR